MKATELIEKLQKIVAENGDVEIHVLDYFDEDEFPIFQIANDIYKRQFGDWVIE